MDPWYVSVSVGMMNPIKIELGLSVSESCEMHRRQIPVDHKHSDGQTQEGKAFVYHVDTRADPQIRMFAVTLLLIDVKVLAPLPAEFHSGTVGVVPKRWRDKKPALDTEAQLLVRTGDLVDVHTGPQQIRNSASKASHVETQRRLWERRKA